MKKIVKFISPCVLSYEDQILLNYIINIMLDLVSNILSIG